MYEWRFSNRWLKLFYSSQSNLEGACNCVSSGKKQQPFPPSPLPLFPDCLALWDLRGVSSLLPLLLFSSLFFVKAGWVSAFFSRSHFVLQFGGAPACKSIIHAQHYCATVRNEEMKWGDLISRANGRRGEKKEKDGKGFSAQRCGKSGDADLSKVQQREEKEGGGKMCKRLVLRFFRFFPPSPSAARTQEKATIKSGAEHPVSSHIFDFSPMCSSYKYT